MGLFDKLKKEEKFQPTIEQEHISINLLLKEAVFLNKENIKTVLSKHLGNVDIIDESNNGLSLALLDYTYLENGNKMPVIMIIKECEITKPIMSDFDIQTSRCQEQVESILNESKYELSTIDMMANLLEYSTRIELIMKYIDALLELVPQCNAVYFDNSKDIALREELLKTDMNVYDKIVHYLVNVRYMTIAGKDEFLVDSLGMSLFGLPDVQYHVKNANPDHIIQHAANILIYILENNNPIKNADKVDGMIDGVYSQEVLWTMRYEDSLTGPNRIVLDVEAGKYAAGNRNY